MDYQSEYNTQQQAYDKLYIACGELTKQLHEQAVEIMGLYGEIEKIKNRKEK